MSGTRYRTFVVVGAVLLALFAMYWSGFFTTTHSITDDLAQFDLVGERVEDDFTQYPLVSLNDEYTLTDTLKDGVEITYGSQASTTFNSPDLSQSLSLQFPKSLSEPLTITLPGNRTFTVTHNVEGHYQSELLTNTTAATDPLRFGARSEALTQVESAEAEESVAAEATPTYLKYTSPNSRTHTYYAYQKDQAAGYRNLKHWTIYQSGTGQETASYTFANAHLKTNDRGEVEVRYLGTYEVPRSGEEGGGAVEADLWARAQAVLAKDALLNIENQPPDLTIPAPYTIDAQGNQVTHEWVVTPQSAIDPSDTSGNYVLSVSFEVPLLGYPIALDPTLQFTAPGTSNSGDVITGEKTSSNFGTSMTTGDWNGDGKTDLAVGASGYDNIGGEGRVYIFWSSSRPDNTAEADVILTGQSTINEFGHSLATGDFNADGTDDLVVGARGYGSSQGRVYTFYGGSLEGGVANTVADDIITGEASFNFFGQSLAVGDFDADGRDDLAVGANYYSVGSFTLDGRAYIFYGDGSIPTTAGTADVTLTGEAANNNFGSSLTTGDYNADGTDDLAVGAYFWNNNATGRAYLFYGGSMVSENASGADVTLTGEATSNQFGWSLTTGDYNADGTDDLAVGAYSYTTNTGRAYLFYGGSMVSENASGADIILTGETTNNRFGHSLITGDYNADGTDDLAVGAYRYNSSQGRAYLFYGGSMVSENASGADVTLTGEATNNSFSYSLTTGDLNDDGKDDLLVGAYQYNSYQGRTYIFYSQSGQVNLNEHITGEGTGDYFGSAFAVGDFNNDGRDDLAVGAPYDNSNTGKVYIFYNDGDYSTLASTSDVILTGSTTGDKFGTALIAGDFNNNGQDDLVITATFYNSNQGGAFIFYGGDIVSNSASSADVIITGEASSYLGDVLEKGDLNNDGVDDLVISSINYGTVTGRAYLFYGGTLSSSSASAADVIFTGESTLDAFGISLTTGDFNADGTDDLAVGAFLYSAQTGRAYLFYGGAMASGNASGADVTLTGETTGNAFGISLTTGDFNHDGTDDLAVGASGYTTNTGRAHLFYGGAMTSKNASGADVTLTGETTDNRFGYSLTTGDFNADGTDDLAVGAFHYSSFTGRAYLFYGGTFTASMEAATSSSIMITGDSANDDFGLSLATGDFNADGKDDLVIGAPGYDNGGDTGRIYFYETREDYAWEIQRQSLADGLRVDPLMGYEMKITGEGTGNSFASAIAMADLNHDGKDDLIVGASAYDSTYINVGKVYIFYNDGNYPARAGRADHVIVGANLNALFGTSMTTGDFNGDGVLDLAVGSYSYSSYQGQTYIFYGPITADSIADADVTLTGEAVSYFGESMTVGDFNDDGTDDLVVGATAYSSSNFTGRAYIFYGNSLTDETATGADVIYTGESTFDFLGYSLAVGDYNNDGVDDLAAGAYFYGTNVGRAYLFFSTSTPGSRNASAADAIYTGESGSSFGASLTAGDYNHDGIDDVAIGASGYTTNTGRTYLFFSTSTPGSRNAIAADVILTGEITNNYFGTSLTTGDFNHDGTDDLAVAAEGYDVTTNSNEGRAYIFYSTSTPGSRAATAADVILTGEGASNSYGGALFSGDLNNDGTDDLLVGAAGYNSSQGRLYFYTTNDRHMTGEGTDDTLGTSFATGDFNHDGNNDLAVGAPGYGANQGRAYLFYGGRKATTSASGADVVLTGQTTGNYFARSLATGDFNNDGTDDLVVGARGHTSNTGRAYIFYGGEMAASLTAGADEDVAISGEGAVDYFSNSFAVGDYNADGRDDLIATAIGYTSVSFTGRAYIFYGGGSFPTAAADADVIIGGENAGDILGYSLTTGDFNADGTDDFVIGATGYSSGAGTGRAYIFYGGALASTTASNANVILTGEDTSNNFGEELSSGDFNADGTDDLAVGAYSYNTSQGRAYIFYGGSMTSESASAADVILTGEDTSNVFGASLTTGDFNADGTDDLAVGAYTYNTSQGRAYIFYGNELRTTGAENANVIVTGEKTSSNFGITLAAGDLNSNGVDDLIISASGYDDTSITNNDEGRVYIITSEAAAERYSHHQLQGTIQFFGTGTFR
ncbi:FG-GAP repeat protein [Candidatus Nomurabacteria bacterium]|nr:FG-GAP repeat protein [Candidatus Nomurabacteria bacterium]